MRQTLGRDEDMDRSIFEKLMAEQASPCFVFDIDALRERFLAIKEILGKDIGLCYSIKANPFFIPELIDLADALEVCSPGELAICRHYSVPPEKIIYSGVNKERWDIKEAADYGAGTFTAESLLHVRYLNDEGLSRGRKLPVLLRLNGGSQFGMSAEDIKKVVKARGDLEGIEICGLHYFIGTQRKEKRQSSDIEKLTAFFEELRVEAGFEFERLEYGPGLKVPYFEGDDFSDTLAPARALAPQLKALAAEHRTTVEMGRFIAAECGYYMTKVMDLKSNEGLNHAILDGGMNHLVYYGQTMAMKTPKFFRIAAGSAPSAGSEDAAHSATCKAYDDILPSTPVRNEKWFLYGSLCSIHDIICKDVFFEDIALGDCLVFENAGAYSVTEGIYLFLSRSMPKIYFVRNGAAELVRGAFRTDVLNRRED